MSPTRPRDIGTAGESAVVRCARARGFPMAERRALRGALDAGDVLLCSGVVLEVKAGQLARTASDALIRTWLKQTERERVNAGADIALLVTVRPGIGAVNAHRWFAHLWSPHYQAPVRMDLGDALTWLRRLGYGSPLEDGAA